MKEALFFDIEKSNQYVDLLRNDGVSLNVILYPWSVGHWQIHKAMAGRHYIRSYIGLMVIPYLVFIFFAVHFKIITLNNISTQ
jgi:hypothetical protein